MCQKTGAPTALSLKKTHMRDMHEGYLSLQQDLGLVAKTRAKSFITLVKMPKSGRLKSTKVSHALSHPANISENR